MTNQSTVLSDDSVSTLERLVGRPLLSIHGTPFVVDGPLICATTIAITSRGTHFDGYHELVVITSERRETKEYSDYGLFAVSRADSDARAFGNRGLMFVDMSRMTIPGATATIREFRLLSADTTDPDDRFEYDIVIEFQPRRPRLRPQREIEQRARQR